MNKHKHGLIGMLVAGALLIGGLGGSLMSVVSANAASTTNSSPTTSTTASAATAPDSHQGGHVANGMTETLLTGDTATKVSAAALQAVPGGTIQRVETDAEGATYEAHITKTDGSQVTVKLDANFKVSGTEAGPVSRQ